MKTILTLIIDSYRIFFLDLNEYDSPVWLSTAQKILRDARGKWRNDEWKTSRKTFLQNIREDIFTKFSTQGLTRKEQVLMTRLRIGHTMITHRHLLDKTAAPQCESCSKPITVEHILCECKKYQHIRKSYISENIKDTLNNHTCNVTQYLRETNQIDC